MLRGYRDVGQLQSRDLAAAVERIRREGDDSPAAQAILRVQAARQRRPRPAE
jgi:hypothetical protein